MATEYNLYIVPLELSTTWGPITPCWLARTHPFWPQINVDSLYGFFDSPVRRVCIEVIGAEPSVHQSIQADTLITRIFPLVSATAAQVRTHYDTALSTLFTGPQLTAIRAKLESVGFDTGWATGATTLRQLLRRFVHYLSTVQIAYGEQNAAMNTLHGLALTDTMTSLTATQRTAARAWMTAKGLDSSWITNATTVRAVVRYINENLPSRNINLGGLES